ncbi:MAG TPA: hypothetical protein VJP80_03660 [Candidatus Saccharimonadales bacterium]|nr:hypothetical protein [Candidatus Saccharimonadales bacterium]
MNFLAWLLVAATLGVAANHMHAYGSLAYVLLGLLDLSALNFFCKKGKVLHFKRYSIFIALHIAAIVYLLT